MSDDETEIQKSRLPAGVVTTTPDPCIKVEDPAGQPTPPVLWQSRFLHPRAKLQTQLTPKYNKAKGQISYTVAVWQATMCNRTNDTQSMQTKYTFTGQKMLRPSNFCYCTQKSLTAHPSKKSFSRYCLLAIWLGGSFSHRVIALIDSCWQKDHQCRLPAVRCSYPIKKCYTHYTTTYFSTHQPFTNWQSISIYDDLWPFNLFSVHPFNPFPPRICNTLIPHLHPSQGAIPAPKGFKAFPREAKVFGKIFWGKTLE